MRLAPLALLFALAFPQARAAELGRLFYTPDQRSSLDVARSKRARNVVGTEKADEAPPPPTPEVVTYGGMVRRSDGKTTIWLNNRAVTGKESPNANMVGKVRPDGTVVLQSQQTGRNVELRVGQRAELLSGRVEERYRSTPAPSPEEKPDAGLKPPPPQAAAPNEAERKQERDRQENIDDALRALRDAAQARAAAADQQPAGGPPLVTTPGPPLAQPSR